MLKQIYHKIIKTQPSTVELERPVDTLIAELTAPYEGKISSQDMDTLKDLLSTVALAGQETGFEIGAKFAAKILRELTN